MIVNVIGPIARPGKHQEKQRFFIEDYSVLTDDLNEHTDDVQEAPAIPAQFTPHSTREGYFLARKAESARKGNLHTVSCEYVRVTIDPNLPNLPWLLPVVKSGGASSTTEPFDQTMTDEPVVNSAEQSFETPLADDLFELDTSYTQNYLSFPDAAIATMGGAVNADPFDGRAAGLCRIVGIGLADEKFNGQPYRTVTWTIRTRRARPVGPDGTGGSLRAWWHRVANRGYHYIGFGPPGPDGPPLYPFLDAQGNPVEGNLGNDGGKAPPGVTTWLEFQSPFAPVLSYANLNLIGL